MLNVRATAYYPEVELTVFANSPSESSFPTSYSPLVFLPYISSTLILTYVCHLTVTEAALTAWAVIGSADIAVVAAASPLSTALPNALQFAVPAGTPGTVGVQNSGYFGT